MNIAISITIGSLILYASTLIPGGYLWGALLSGFVSAVVWRILEGDL